MENSKLNVNLTKSNTNQYMFLSHDIIDFILLIAIVFLILFNILTHISHKYQFNKLINLFSDFTRFYIHISKPPCRELTNLDLFNEVPSKKSSNSLTSFSSTTNSNTNNSNINSSQDNSKKLKISTINEIKNENLVKNFKSRLFNFTKQPLPSKKSQPSSYEKYISMLSKSKSKIDKNNRRHSAYDLINRTDLIQDKLKEKSHFKIKQSESYSFDMNNKLYSNVIVNEVKEKRDFAFKKNEIPKRRSRLMGISDDIPFATKNNANSNFNSTSTPNK